MTDTCAHAHTRAQMHTQRERDRKTLAQMPHHRSPSPTRPLSLCCCQIKAWRASCAATPRQSAAPASCSSILTTRTWSAVGFAAVRVSARAAATQSPLCPAFQSGSNRGKGCGFGRQSDGEAFACDSVSLCVSVWRSRAHVHRCTSHTLTHSFVSHIRVCVCV